jgi:hypothetical protein
MFLQHGFVTHCHKRPQWNIPFHKETYLHIGPLEEAKTLVERKAGNS